MVAESGTAPEEWGTPQGWEPLIPGRRFFRLAPTHPDYPHDWRTTYAEAERRRLEADERTTAAIGRLGELWSLVERAMKTTPRFEDFYQAIRVILDALDREAELIPVSDATTRRAYLAEQVLPENLASLAGMFTSNPVEIVVNDDTESMPASVAPGETLIRLAGMPVGRFDKLFLRFVTEAQTIARQNEHRNKGGRRARPADPQIAERCKTAAKLAHWGGYSNPQIAEFFGWCSAEMTRKQLRDQADRAGEYVVDGTSLLEKEIGPDWNHPKRIPQRLRERVLLIQQVKSGRERRRKENGRTGTISTEGEDELKGAITRNK